jgi:phenylacetate-CoA ligase
MTLPDLAEARGRVRAAQLAALRKVLSACERNPFYGPRLAEAGLRAGELRTVEDLRRLAPVAKQELLDDQESSPPWGARLGVPPDEVREIHLTSGTSGLGQEAMALTAADVEWSGATWVPVFANAGLEAGDLFANFYPATVFAYGRSVLSGGRVANVPVVSLAGLDRSVALELLRRLQPRALGARPALFGLIDQDLAAAGTRPAEAFPDLRSIITSGLALEQALLLQQRWGVVVHEVYGMSQAAGVIAGTGPEGAAPHGEPGVMRCNEELFLVEPVHPETLEPVEEGEAELLLTCLRRSASPMLRFRTRDRVQVVPAGSYGAGVPNLGLLVGSVGRWDDMIKLRGNNVWPGQLDDALLGAPGVLDYLAQVTLDERGVEQLRIAVCPDPALGEPDDAVADALARRVKARTNVRAHVSFDAALSTPGLKPKRLVDRRSR